MKGATTYRFFVHFANLKAARPELVGGEWHGTKFELTHHAAVVTLSRLRQMKLMGREEKRDGFEVILEFKFRVRSHASPPLLLPPSQDKRDHEKPWQGKGYVCCTLP